MGHSARVEHDVDTAECNRRALAAAEDAGPPGMGRPGPYCPARARAENASAHSAVEAGSYTRLRASSPCTVRRSYRPNRAELPAPAVAIRKARRLSAPL